VVLGRADRGAVVASPDDGFERVIRVGRKFLSGWQRGLGRWRKILVMVVGAVRRPLADADNGVERIMHLVGGMDRQPDLGALSQGQGLFGLEQAVLESGFDGDDHYRSPRNQENGAMTAL